MSRRVLVIGAGVSGLTTARCLLEAGCKVTIVAEKSAEFTPSVVAGALWEWPPAVCGHHTDLESLRRSKRWAADSYERFQSLAKRPETGVRLIPAVFYFRHRLEDLPKELQKMEEAARHVQGFERTPDLIARHGANANFGLRDAYMYLSPLIETDIYMRWLKGELVERGCQFVTRQLTQPLTTSERALLEEFAASAIVNCSGLGSIELAPDRMSPLRGALIRLKNDGGTIPRLAVAHTIAHDETAARPQMIYIIPRGENHLLLGGIAELDEWELDINLDNHAPIRDILHRCQEFLPALKHAEIDPHLPVRVGLRPYREKNVRLAREGQTSIFHNYGHGGSGFTFSWGCAAEATALVLGATGSASA